MPSLGLNLAGAIIHISTKSVLSICQTMLFCRKNWGPDGGPKGGSTFCTDPFACFPMPFDDF